jgi:hypothetical protein
MAARRNPKVAAFIATCAAGWGACSSNHGVPLDELVARFTTAACSALTRCHQSSDEAYCEALGLWSDLKETNSLARKVAAAQQGRLKYDGNVAQACLDALATTGCDMWQQGGRYTIGTDACLRFFSGGSVADGAACTVDLECAPGSACMFKSGCDQGACTSSGSGEECVSDDQCPKNNICASQCRAVTLKGLGEYCDAAGLFCQAGLTCCTASSYSSNVCEPPVTEGSLCDYTSDCADGLICLQASGNTLKTCQRIAAKGEACQAPGQCGGIVMSNLTCDLTAQVCVDMPSSGPCGDGKLFGSRCDIATSYCGGTADAPTCLPYSTITTAAVGEACGSAATGKVECDSSGYCELSSADFTGTCVPFPACTP